MKACLIFLALIGVIKVEAGQYVDEPQGCYQEKKYPCAIRAVGKSLSVVEEKYAFKLGAQSNLYLKSALQFQLLSGSIWVVKGKEVKFETTYVDVQGDGEFWIENLNSDATIVKNINAQLSLKDSQKVEQSLPIGYENWYGGVRVDRTVHQGIIKPIESKKFFKMWNRVAHLPKNLSMKKIASYKQIWAGNLDESSDLYKEVIQREIASENYRENQKVLRLQKQKEEQRVLRQAFRNRLSER